MAKKRKHPKYYRDSKNPPPLRLQERDIQILKTVYDYRFLQTDHIQALLPGSREGIRRRLQKLYHNGYLERFFLPLPLGVGSSKAIYTLDKKGAQLLIKSFGYEPERLRWHIKQTKTGANYLQHALMISNFRATLTMAVNSQPDLELLFWKQGKELRDYVEIRDERGRRIRIPVVPDAFFGLKDKRGRMYFFLEADRGTMTMSRFLRKMRGYWIYWKRGLHTKRYHIRNFRVLTVTNSQKRVENLARVTQKADDRKQGSKMFWFTHDKQIRLDDPQSIVGAIWKTPIEGDGLHSLLD